MWLGGDACEKGGEKADGGPEERGANDGRCCAVMVFGSDMLGYRSVCGQI